MMLFISGLPEAVRATGFRKQIRDALQPFGGLARKVCPLCIAQWPVPLACVACCIPLHSITSTAGGAHMSHEVAPPLPWR